jgi:peptidoglycan/xylan/chitin deacetylase (PgdA/CDA1 family)
MNSLFTRALSKGRRTLASGVWRRELRLQTPVPLVSFTFDDAPVSAYETGAALLQAHGARGTFYVSLGLLGAQSELGPIGTAEHMRHAYNVGHEIGCHTFDHLDAWACSRFEYIHSVQRNKDALAMLLPQARMRSFAYPKSGAHLAVKPQLQQRFDCCRGGGQDINSGRVDLNRLNAVFIDKRARMSSEALRLLVQRNAQRRGWLIFAAHDISDDGGDFSCSPGLFGELLQAAMDSGAQILPVAEACAQLRQAAKTP